MGYMGLNKRLKVMKSTLYVPLFFLINISIIFASREEALEKLKVLSETPCIDQRNLNYSLHEKPKFDPDFFKNRLNKLKYFISACSTEENSPEDVFIIEEDVHYLLPLLVTLSQKKPFQYYGIVQAHSPYIVPKGIKALNKSFQKPIESIQTIREQLMNVSQHSCPLIIGLEYEKPYIAGSISKQKLYEELFSILQGYKPRRIVFLTEIYGPNFKGVGSYLRRAEIDFYKNHYEEIDKESIFYLVKKLEELGNSYDVHVASLCFYPDYYYPSWMPL